MRMSGIIMLAATLVMASVPDCDKSLIQPFTVDECFSNCDYAFISRVGVCPTSRPSLCERACENNATCWGYKHWSHNKICQLFFDFEADGPRGGTQNTTRVSYPGNAPSNRARTAGSNTAESTPPCICINSTASVTAAHESGCGDMSKTGSPSVCDMATTTVYFNNSVDATSLCPTPTTSGGETLSPCDCPSAGLCPSATGGSSDQLLTGTISFGTVATTHTFPSPSRYSAETTVIHGGTVTIYSGICATSDTAETPTICNDAPSYLYVTATTTVYRDLYTAASQGNSALPSPCPCLQTGNASSSVEEEQIRQLVSQLSLERGNLSSARRKLTSAPDPRRSSKAIGSTVIVILVAAYIPILIADVIKICRVCVGFKESEKRQDRV